jgi:hypothetical protein
MAHFRALQLATAMFFAEEYEDSADMALSVPGDVRQLKSSSPFRDSAPLQNRTGTGASKKSSLLAPSQNDVELLIPSLYNPRSNN